MGIRGTIYGILLVVCLGFLAAGGWYWRHERNKADRSAHEQTTEAVKKAQRAKYIAEVLRRMDNVEGKAISAEQVEPKRSLEFLQSVPKEMGQIETGGCPEDFQIEFLRCKNALDRTAMHAQDLVNARRRENDQILGKLAVSVLMPGIRLALLLPKSASGDPLVDQASMALIKDRDQYLDGRAKLAEIAINYGVNVTNTASVLPDPASSVSTPHTETLTIPAMKTSNLPLSFTPEQTPGRLVGHWSSQGKSADIAGAHDDSIVSFTIRDSNNAVVQHHDHPISGNFDIRYLGGTYTLTFDNGGIVRSSARIVVVEWTYQPD